MLLDSHETVSSQVKAEESTVVIAKSNSTVSIAKGEGKQLQLQPQRRPSKDNEEDLIPYWKKSALDLKEFREGSIVVIHVCDENREQTLDFCCKRQILIEHMKYFESFLQDSDNGFDDVVVPL